MLGKLRGQLTYANVVASIALFVALGGTSVAAIQLSKDSVKAKQIAKGAVGTSEVKDRALRARDFAKGQLPRGAQGPVGPQGVPGPAGLGNLVVREVTKNVAATCIDPGGLGTYFCNPVESTVTITCEPGERPIFANGAIPEPVGSAPTGFKVFVTPLTTTSPVPTIPVVARIVCASP